MQPWTYTSEFSWMNMDFLCMCVKFNYLTMDYPLYTPAYKSMDASLDISFNMHAYMRFATEWRVSDNRGRPRRLVCDIIGVREFRLGGRRSCSCPNILSIACPKIKWFYSNIIHDVCPKMAI